MTTRRRLLSSIGAATVLATAGCLGGGDGPAGSGTSAPDGAKNVKGQITGMTADGTAVSLSIKDSSKVSAVNLINEDGEHVASTSVATGASTVSLSFLERSITGGGYNSKPTGEYRFVAVNDKEKQVGAADFIYEPAVELADVSTGAEEFPDEDGSEKWLVLSVTNRGTAPGVFDGMQFTALPEKAVNNVGEADQKLPRLIQTEGIQNGKYGRGSLNTLDGTEEENIEKHVLEPGDTRQYIKTGFFKSFEDDVNTNEIESCDFERAFKIRVFSTPTVEDRVMHEVTAELTGELNIDHGFTSSNYWCGNSTITGMKATESTPQE